MPRTMRSCRSGGGLRYLQVLDDASDVISTISDIVVVVAVPALDTG
jgi:hypothetical protein